MMDNDTSAEPVVSSALPDSSIVDGNDTDFEITAEMMVDDIDDERTIEEEEQDLEQDGDFSDEINELEKEGEMPLEDLLLMYGYENTAQSSTTVPDDVPLPSAETPAPWSDTLGPISISPAAVTTPVAEEDCTSVVSEGSNSVESAEQSSANQEENYDPFHNQRITRGLAALNSQYFDDSSSDDEYQPYNEDWKKEVQIGPNHQAEVPEAISCEIEVITAEDKLLWKPDIIEGSKQLQAAIQAIMQSSGQEIGNCERDDEQALYTLLQNNGDVAAALRNAKDESRGVPEVSLWSEEECKQFELGLKVYGKNFRVIQHNKVSSRSVGEIVQFYYLWKKTERHDLFVMQSRLGKRKYGLPGVADYMDRFMDENESIVSSRAASPGLPSEPNTHDIGIEVAKRLIDVAAKDDLAKTESEQSHKPSHGTNEALDSINSPSISHLLPSNLQKPTSDGIPERQEGPITKKPKQDTMGQTLKPASTSHSTVGIDVRHRASTYSLNPAQTVTSKPMPLTTS